MSRVEYPLHRAKDLVIHTVDPGLPFLDQFRVQKLATRFAGTSIGSAHHLPFKRLRDVCQLRRLAL